MESVFVKVNDFNVEYKQSEYKTHVEIYVDGNLNEDRQSTWYLRMLLDKTINLKKELKEAKKENKELKKELKIIK